MTVYSYLELNGTRKDDIKDIRVRKNVGATSRSSRADIILDNFTGRNKSSGAVGDAVKVSVGQVPTGGLTAYYSYEGDAKDQIGTNDGTVSGATQALGKISKCYTFDGVNDKITHTYTTANVRCVAFWAFVPDSTPAATKGFCAGATNGANKVILLTTGVVRAEATNTGGTATTRINSTANVTNNAWNHFVVDFDGFKIYINGVDRTDTTSSIAVKAHGNLEIGTSGTDWYNDKIDEFAVYNRALTLKEIGEIYNSGDGVTCNRIFNGLAEEISFRGEGSNDEEMVIIARDYMSLLQKSTIEPEVYSSQTITTIVNDIMDKYAPAIITTTNVDTSSTTVTRMAFNQDSVFDALQKLAELANFVFYIDDNIDLHFEERLTEDSGLTFNNTNVINSSFRTDIDTVRNKVYVYGARQLVKAPQESFTANGVGSVFTLTQNPHNTQVAVAGTQKKGGVYEINVTHASGNDYLVNFHDKTIVFVSGTTIGYSAIPASLATVAVDYWKSAPIIKLATDESSISDYQARTEIIVDKNIKDPRQARELAYNLLAQKASPIIEGRIQIQGVVKVNPGVVVNVNLPNEDQSNVKYEVIEATYRINKKTALAENILELTLNKRVNDISDVLKQILQDIKKLNAGEVDDTAVISRLEHFTGSVALQIVEWKIKTRGLGHRFMLSDSTNGKLGSPVLGYDGSQVGLGSFAGEDFVVQVSGT